MPIFLGIDGGGTKTTCALGDGKRVLATGEGGGSNIVRCGEAQTLASIHEAMRNACAAGGIKPDAIESACIGAAGASLPDVSAQIKRIAAGMLACPVLVVGDMVIALAAAFGNGPGVIAIAGTGSIAYGRDSEGRTARAGGWGFAISDEGSGQWIGRTAVAQALRRHDEGKDSRLVAGLLQAWPAASIDDLVRAANATPPADFSRLFPAVLEAADGGDTTARETLVAAGVQLADLAKVVLQRLFPDVYASVPVAMAGGVLRQSALVRQSFFNDVRATFPTALVNPTLMEPVLGALELARNRATFLALASGKGAQPQ